MKKIKYWVVVMHFGRGSVQTFRFLDKKEASEAVRIAVFNNEDCVNCNIYVEDVKVPDIEEPENLNPVI